MILEDFLKSKKILEDPEKLEMIRGDSRRSKLEIQSPQRSVFERVLYCVFEKNIII